MLLSSAFEWIPKVQVSQLRIRLEDQRFSMLSFAVTSRCYVLLLRRSATIPLGRICVYGATPLYYTVAYGSFDHAVFCLMYAARSNFQTNANTSNSLFLPSADNRDQVDWLARVFGHARTIDETVSASCTAGHRIFHGLERISRHITGANTPELLSINLLFFGRM